MREHRRRGARYGAHRSAPAAWLYPYPAGSGCRSPHPSSLPDFVILDRFLIHCSSSRDAAEDEELTASTTTYTCTGRPVRASLKVEESPAVSRLNLHWLDRKELSDMPQPRVIAADRHSILFSARIPFESGMSDFTRGNMPEDFFVYSAFSWPPSLHRLPACLIGGTSIPEADKFYKPYGMRQQVFMNESDMGILSHGQSNGTFTVAALGDLTKFIASSTPEAELYLLHHRPASSIGTEWRVRKVRFPPPVRPALYHNWMSDAVVPIGDRFLCWVDYYQGVLIVDILLANDERSPDLQFRYIPLPEEALGSHRQYPDGDRHDPNRSVCVTLAGMLKLVCITDVVFSSPPSFKVTTWTLHDFYRGKWVKDGTMESFEFWRASGKDLPYVKPGYPAVCLVNPDVIFFRLAERGNFRIVEVDIKEKVLNRSVLIEVERKEGIAIFPRTRLCGESFIFSQFTAYLRKEAMRRLKAREMAEKTAIQLGLGIIGKQVKQPKEHVKGSQMPCLTPDR